MGDCAAQLSLLLGNILLVRTCNRYGFLPKEESYDCFYFRLKYSPMEGDAVAEANRMQALQSLADDVRPAVGGFILTDLCDCTDQN